MGEDENGRTRLDFTGRLRPEFRGEKVTIDAGLPAARIVNHARRTVLRMAEVAVPEALFAKILARIRQLATVPT